MAFCPGDSAVTMEVSPSAVYGQRLDRRYRRGSWHVAFDPGGSGVAFALKMVTSDIVAGHPAHCTTAVRSFIDVRGKVQTADCKRSCT